jgi:hypothetical protein
MDIPAAHDGSAHAGKALFSLFNKKGGVYGE